MTVFTAAFSAVAISAAQDLFDVFGGHIEGNGSIDFAKALYSKLKLTGHDLRLERALKETTKFESNLAGVVTLDGSTSVTLRKFPTDLDGSGHISIKDGQLWSDSLYRGLMEEAGQTDTGKDSGSTEFSLRPDRVEFKKLLVVGGTTAAHGEGELLFNNRINFRVNAGVIERIEESLGSIGDVLELMTDRVVKYQVTGTWARPEFNIRPLGLGADAEKVDPPN